MVFIPPIFLIVDMIKVRLGEVSRKVGRFCLLSARVAHGGSRAGFAIFCVVLDSTRNRLLVARALFGSCLPCEPTQPSVRLQRLPHLRLWPSPRLEMSSWSAYLLRPIPKWSLLWTLNKRSPLRACRSLSQRCTCIFMICVYVPCCSS
jgi:hypothetical protein